MQMNNQGATVAIVGHHGAFLVVATITPVTVEHFPKPLKCKQHAYVNSWLGQMLP